MWIDRLARLSQWGAWLGLMMSMCGALLLGVAWLQTPDPTMSQVEACCDSSVTYQEVFLPTPTPTVTPDVPNNDLVTDTIDIAGLTARDQHVDAIDYLPRPLQMALRRPPPTDSLTDTLDNSEAVVSQQALPADPPNRSEAVVSQQALPADASPGAFQCPTSSTNRYSLIPVAGPSADRSTRFHGDLSVSVRGYQGVSVAGHLVDYSGDTDPQAPQLAGIFLPARLPLIKATYRVNHWDWNCNCPGGLVDDWETTLVGLSTAQGEPLAIPARGPQIYAGGYVALVLHATERQLTVAYTRHDTVAAGYVVHMLDLCVDPNLLAMYRGQNNANGWRSTRSLPALWSNQPVGVAAGSEVKVAIRDNGSFMDPRSRKDWWNGY